MSISLNKADEELERAFFHLQTGRGVAALLDVGYDRLIYHLHKTPESTRYTTFHIPKRAGGAREILAPVTALKILQRKLNQVLQAVGPRKPQVHGFVRGKGILSNSVPHCSKRLVLKFDLEDFFPSINFGRVRGMFMARPYGRNAEVATILSKICCFQNRLPQGAPTSPIVSNMICAKLDSELLRLAERFRCSFTRYADDLTFSSYRRRFPVELVKVDASGVSPGTELQTIIQDNGFRLNLKKLRLHSFHQRQMVTGLVVNKVPNVTRQYKNQLRAMLHAWRKFGLAAAEQHYYERYYLGHRSPNRNLPVFWKVLQGKIDYLGHIKGRNDRTYIEFRNQLQPLISQVDKNRKPNLIWFAKKPMDRYQLTLDFEDNVGIRLLPDTESEEADGYLQVHSNIVCVEMANVDHHSSGGNPRKVRRKVLTQEEVELVRQTYLAHVPREPAFQGEMGPIVTRYSPSVCKIVVSTFDGTTKLGTGFIAYRRNILVTAYHCVDPERVVVQYAEFEKLQVKCRLLKFEPSLDVAVLELEREIEVWPIKIKRLLQMPNDRGMHCITIGFPDEPGYHPRSVPAELSITDITGNYLMNQEVLTLSRSLGSGTSGSPIMNRERSLVGMVIGFGSSDQDSGGLGSRENLKWSAAAVSCNDLLRFIQSCGIN
jgi:RNA-directed DNA polymerase